jgi:hypothetical protein
MNNRVRELIKEHGSDSSGKWVAVDKVELIAEMIVKECAEVGSFGHGCIDSEYIKRAVLEHFGVEE